MEIRAKKPQKATICQRSKGVERIKNTVQYAKEVNELGSRKEGTKEGFFHFEETSDKIIHQFEAPTPHVYVYPK